MRGQVRGVVELDRGAALEGSVVLGEPRSETLKSWFCAPTGLTLSKTNPTSLPAVATRPLHTEAEGFRET